MIKNYDLNQDGIIDDNDATVFEKIKKTDIELQRDNNQLKMAWVAMFSIILVTLLLFSPFVTDTRIQALDNVLDLFYVAQASVIGFYVGAKTYLSSKRHGEG